MVRGGLWEQEVSLSQYGKIDFSEVYRVAEEQSVVGLVAAGLDHVNDVKAPQEITLTFVGTALQLEQKNRAMNEFIGDIVGQMRKMGIYALIVKGQGVAQCYERPLWRACGDVDFLMSEENFLEAREYLRPLVANGFDPSGVESRNISAQLPPWDIELHTNQYIGLSKRIDKGIEEVQRSVFFEGRVRSWMNNKTQIFLPSEDNDAIFIFTHFLKHFYKGGLGLRQICDWCRLLWKYQEKIDRQLLENRLRKMGLMSEWKAFAAYAVDFMGMPIEAMPLYSDGGKWSRKARRINAFVMKVGNMGHSRDNSFYGSKSFLVRKAGSFGRRIRDLFSHAMIFPLDSLRFLPRIVFNGLRSAAKGIG